MSPTFTRSGGPDSPPLELAVRDNGAVLRRGDIELALDLDEVRWLIVTAGPAVIGAHVRPGT